MPYRLYNMGGSLANLLFSALCLLLYFICREYKYPALFLIICAVIGLFIALLNGIPMRIQNMDNDGYNALNLGKDTDAIKAIWLQLKINQEYSLGKRLKDLPEEWFFLPEGEDLNDPMICTVGVMKYNYYYDTHDFEKAEETAEYLLKAPGLLGLHKNELTCELLFLRVFRKADPSEIDPLYTRELDKYIKATANYVSRRRLAYAYQLLYLKNLTMAEKCLAVFEKTVKTYPYSAEIENELEIIEMIKDRAEIH